MMRKELVRQPDGSYKEQYVDKGPSKALPNLGVRKGVMPIAIGRS